MYSNKLIDKLKYPSEIYTRFQTLVCHSNLCLFKGEIETNTVYKNRCRVNGVRNPKQKENHN